MIPEGKLYEVSPWIGLPFRRAKGLFIKQTSHIESVKVPMIYTIGFGQSPEEAKRMIASEIKSAMLEKYGYPEAVIDQIDRILIRAAYEKEVESKRKYRLTARGKAIIEDIIKGVVDNKSLDGVVSDFVSIFPNYELDWREIDHTWLHKMGPDTKRRTMHHINDLLHVHKLIDTKYPDIEQMIQISSSIENQLICDAEGM